MTSVAGHPAPTFAPATPLCIALDTTDRAEMESLVRATAAYAGLFKIGVTAFVSLGEDPVREISEARPVFLDLKLHDIPAQVAGAVRAAAGTGASLLTVHASGGREMVRAAADAAPAGLAIVAVTILTSLDDGSLAELGFRDGAEDSVLRLAAVALEAGADGLVCSPREVGALRSRFGSSGDGGPLLVVPGIRPEGASSGDQKRTLGPAAAIEAGADVIVVGRPITAAEDPERAAAGIAKEIA